MHVNDLSDMTDDPDVSEGRAPIALPFPLFSVRISSGWGQSNFIQSRKEEHMRKHTLWSSAIATAFSVISEKSDLMRSWTKDTGEIAYSDQKKKSRGTSTYLQNLEVRMQYSCHTKSETCNCSRCFFFGRKSCGCKWWKPQCWISHKEHRWRNHSPKTLAMPGIPLKAHLKTIEKGLTAAALDVMWRNIFVDGNSTHPPYTAYSTEGVH